MSCLSRGSKASMLSMFEDFKVRFILVVHHGVNYTETCPISYLGRI